MKITAKPADFECTLAECPPGPFLFDNMVGFKSEYRTETGNMEVFCDSGEFFWGGRKTELAREIIRVIPLEFEVEE